MRNLPQKSSIHVGGTAEVNAGFVRTGPQMPRSKNLDWRFVESRQCAGTPFKINEVGEQIVTGFLN